MRSLYLLTLLLTLATMNGSAQQAPSKDTVVVDSRVFTKPEVPAEYPGGDTAWLHFLIRNMRYPDDAVNHEIQGTVIVQFIVNKDSTVSDVKAITGPDKGGLREEAVRVIALSGKWIPAKQNGYDVRAYKRQPLVFKLTKG
jgi:periplasmic protein TonB